MPPLPTDSPVLIRSLCLGAALVLAAGCQEDAPVGTVPQPALRPLPPDPVPSWLDANVHPFDGTDLALPHTDLGFFRDIVGDARIVALGEGTHGTRDFFEMKARILRFLVEEMGFNTFAIEASWPESRRIDRYVRTGVGDPEVLLSGLYFWTWNTESVLEMIEWMRDYNDAGGDVGFHGFDMQFPGMALHNVREYVGEVAPELLEDISAQLGCLDNFANNPRGRSPRPSYRDQSDSHRAECALSLEGVRERLLAHRDEFVTAGGEDAFEVALQSLRVAFQYHLVVVGEQGRDESMAENTEWLSRRIGPDGRMVLWAHNGHVADRLGWQGSFLRETFGDDMVIVAFSHERGRLTARRELERFCGERTVFDLDDPISGSYERLLARAAAPRFVLDLRDVDADDPGGAWLAEMQLFRSIGACYDPANPQWYWYETPLTAEFDVLIHFESTGPTTVLPFRYPESW
ncbi:MAG: erythromycin esterase family protein [Acidobacteria bacterium]|nr:erythromycin esterase family protein [Acidobacteriota bacterium]MYF15358.1 erythromycin esterase family protein [Acidobacteriota bacterium]MYH22981.1 erythromycin esterase family protein [Acidobacteriota bacterium]MYI96435.1 erythromycin esterase family protein [Acidobacteriota bacterium]MYK78538.1 erythromycin esterase family protein [Acidobacteriota bacterium]